MTFPAQIIFLWAVTQYCHVAAIKTENIWTSPRTSDTEEDV